MKKLTNDEVYERVTLNDKLIERLIVKSWKLEDRIDELERIVKYLCITLGAISVIAAVMFYIVA